MPNQLDGNGLQIKTVAEIKNDIVTGFQTVYGGNINVDPSTPDGQAIGIFAQADIDNLELLSQVYASFSIGGAIGINLDQRVDLNGLSRKPGTFTFTNIDVVVDRAITLPGLDAQLDADTPTGTIYTIADDVGNKYYLAATAVISVAGTSTLSFRAQNRGEVLTAPNTITNQVTVTTGVVSVNNPTTAASIGIDEETDAALRIRHARSFSLAATGPTDALAAALLQLTEVTDVFVAENDAAGVVNGVPAHSIWTIVEGGSRSDIAAIIYSKKMPGCGQTGSTTVNVTRPNGTYFVAKFDRPIAQDLYLKLTVEPKVPGVTFDTDVIKASLVAALLYKLNQSANIGDIVVAMLNSTPLAICTAMGVSANGSDWYDILAPLDYQHKFVVDASRITVL